MDNSTAERPFGDRLQTLLSYLDSDTENLSLLTDAAEAALSDGRPGLTQRLLDRYLLLAPLPPQEMNLAALAAMQLGEFDAATDLFAKLRGEHGRARRRVKASRADGAQTRSGLVLRCAGSGAAVIEFWQPRSRACFD